MESSTVGCAFALRLGLGKSLFVPHCPSLLPTAPYCPLLSLPAPCCFLLFLAVASLTKTISEKLPNDLEATESTVLRLQGLIDTALAYVDDVVVSTVLHYSFAILCC